MKGSIVRVMIASALLSAAVPAVARAQVEVQVRVYRDYGENGWHAYRPIYVPTARVREVVYYTPRTAVRVPPGHLPPPGLCRAWYPGTPPGHQPPPERCERLFRRDLGPGVVILGAPRHDAGWDVDYDREDARGRGNGRGRGRGRAQH